MLEAVQKSLFSEDYHLRRDGRDLALLDLSKWRTSAELALGPERYRFRRERRLSGAFLLERDGQLLARAEKPSVFRSRFTVELAGRQYLLKKRSTLGRTFLLLEDGVEVGRMRRRGFFIRTVRFEFPEDWPVAAQAFVFWLALVVWTREDSAAAGG